MAEGYGADVWCLDRMTTGKLARGRQLLMQAIYHRLTTPRGTLRGSAEAQAYGLDLAGLIGKVGYDRRGVISGMIAAELKKDDRITEVVVNVTKTTATNGEVSLVIVIDITPADESGDFRGTLAANDNAVAVIALGEAA